MRIAAAIGIALVGLLALGLMMFTGYRIPNFPDGVPAPPVGVHPPGQDMAEAAQAFLNTLTPDLRAEATFAFDDEERYNWHFTPRERKGPTIGMMTTEQRMAVHALLQTALSSQGYLKATSIMYLEEILKVLENGSPRRDFERYHVSIFGTPGPEAPWGWRVEGHHLSLNFSSVTDSLVATTPSFMGSNPALVPSGPKAGLRVLAAEEDLARTLLSTLTDEQRATAILPGEAPDEIVTGVARTAELETMAGLPLAAMDAAQQDLLMRLVEEYIHNMRDDLAAAQMQKIRDAGVEHLHFVWMGDTERGIGHPHYYRIHGPTLLIEYDNTQNNANHIHTVVRDLTGDWGEDLLRKHYEESPHHE